jgi:hypothetical protein
VRRHRQLGFGDYTDFSSLIAAEPAAASAWQNQVQNQLTAEGNGPNSQLAQLAQHHFYSAFTQLSQSIPTTTVAAIAPIANAAASLAAQNTTIAGAGQLVGGLVQGALSGNPAQIMQAFSGSLCALAGAAVAAGSLSFGVGAAIMVGIELADLIGSDLFGSKPTVATVCGANLSYQPGIIVNCAWSTGSPQQPGYGQLGASVPTSNPFWRRFPEPNNPGDAWWFSGIGSAVLPSSVWTSGKSSDTWYAIRARPIDAAFPQYHQLECDAAAAYPVAALPDGGSMTYSADDVAFARFVLAYFGAWKANAEFSLNGITPTYGSDANVLMGAAGLGGALGFWNSAHTPGVTRVVTPRAGNNTKAISNVFPWPNKCAGTFETEWWYVSMLLNDANVNSITVNTGAPRTFGTAPTASNLAPMSGSRKLALGAAGAVGSVALVGGAGAVGAALYQGLPWSHYLVKASTGAIQGASDLWASILRR